MDTNSKLYIKQGTFANQSKLNNYSSSYKGLHSEESMSLSYSQEEIEESVSLSENNKNHDSLSVPSSDEIKSNEENTNENEKEVIYTFIWEEGGNNVKVTGSFVNWSTQFDMNYYPGEKLFKYKTILSKEKHTFKYIVDGIWKCSQKYPTTKDNSNNMNNFIDLKNYKNPEKLEPKKKAVKKEKEKKQNKKKEKKLIKKKKDRGYGINFPTKDDLNIEAPAVQPNYLETFLIDQHTNQNFIGRSQYLEYKINEPFTEEKSYKELMMAPHISINHSLKSVDKLDLLETGMNFRFRDKNCTLVYYSHQPK